MDMSKTIESKYLKGDDLQGRTVRVIIDGVEMQDLSAEGQPADVKAIVRLRDRTKGWVLNKTNTQQLIALYGAESEDWRGKEVELFTTPVTVNGQLYNAIRCKQPADPSVDADVAF